MTGSLKILDKDAVAALHNKYQDGLKKKAVQLITHANIELSDRAISYAADILSYMNRLRVDNEFSAEDICESVQRFVSVGEAERTSCKKTIFERVDQRERARESRPGVRSEYGAADLSDEDQAKFQAAHKTRYDPEYIEGCFDDNGRVYLELVDNGDSQTRQETAEFFETLPEKFEITDWVDGKATDKQGKQTYKIGKILSKTNSYLYEAFQHDPMRLSGRLLVVVSRNPDDIARASTNRKWLSCMGAGKRANSQAFWLIEDEIKAGSLVAYLISENDPDIHCPLARAMIKPFRKCASMKISDMAASLKAKFNRSSAIIDRIYVPNVLYGLKNPAFAKTVHMFADSILNKGALKGQYSIDPRVYNDWRSKARFDNGKTAWN